MKLIFLTIGKVTTPSTRFRVKQYIDYLKEDGIACEVKNIPHAFYQRFVLLKDLKDYDAVIIQKKLFSALELRSIKKANQNIIYDFDDLVTVEHPMHEITKKVVRKIKKNTRRFENVLRSSAGVIAGNSFLAEKALELNENTVIIPTPMETTNLPVKEASPGENLVIGWIGTKSNLFYLEHFKGAWQKVLNKFPSASLKVVCNRPYDADRIRIINKEWRKEDEVADLLSFDIGIMPLTDDDWSKGKCGFKLLQYMAAGLPTVASNIGTNCEIIDNGVNGFLAVDEHEWIAHLSDLLSDASLRMSIGSMARKLVEEKYSVRVCKERLIEAIKKFTKS